MKGIYVQYYSYLSVQQNIGVNPWFTGSSFVEAQLSASHIIVPVSRDACVCTVNQLQLQKPETLYGWDRPIWAESTTAQNTSHILGWEMNSSMSPFAGYVLININWYKSALTREQDFSSRAFGLVWKPTNFKRLTNQVCSLFIWPFALTYLQCTNLRLFVTSSTGTGKKQNVRGISISGGTEAKWGSTTFAILWNCWDSSWGVTPGQIIR